MKIKYIFFSVVLLFCNSLLFAQIKLSGYVFDKLTQRPIPYVNVALENSTYGAATNYDGFFIFAGPQIDVTSQLVFQAVGYQKQVLPAHVFVGKDKAVYLSPVTIEMREFTKVSRAYMKNPNQIVSLAIKRLSTNRSKRNYVIYGTYHNIFQRFEGFDVKNYSKSKVEIEVNENKQNTNADKIKITEVQNADSFWSQFRYNSHAVLPQYHIPDFGTNHLSFLLNMNSVRYHSRPTFDFVQTLDDDFLKNHWFCLDSIRSYNGRSTYFVNVFLKAEYRYVYVNVVPHYYLTSGVLNHYSFNGRNGKSAQLSVGKIWVDVDDNAIVYFEYYNGFLNDRYKFCAEYRKMQDEEYYPSKLYFANKFWMKDKPDFNQEGEVKSSYLSCDKGFQYYEGLVKKFSQKAADRFLVNSIIAQNSIYELKSPYQHLNDCYAIARTKASEEILEYFELWDYSKYFHHRLLRVDSIKTRQKTIEEMSSYTDFDKNIFYLGDPAQHVFLYNEGAEKDKWVDKNNFKRTITGAVLGPKVRRVKTQDPILIPITSKDEYHYMSINPEDTVVYDKEHLIKGYVRFFEYVDTKK